MDDHTIVDAVSVDNAMEEDITNIDDEMESFHDLLEEEEPGGGAFKATLREFSRTEGEMYTTGKMIASQTIEMSEMIIAATPEGIFDTIHEAFDMWGGEEPWEGDRTMTTEKIMIGQNDIRQANLFVGNYNSQFYRDMNTGIGLGQRLLAVTDAQEMIVTAGIAVTLVGILFALPVVAGGTAIGSLATTGSAFISSSPYIGSAIIGLTSYGIVQTTGIGVGKNNNSVMAKIVGVLHIPFGGEQQPDYYLLKSGTPNGQEGYTIGKEGARVITVDGYAMDVYRTDLRKSMVNQLSIDREYYNKDGVLLGVEVYSFQEYAKIDPSFRGLDSVGSVSNNRFVLRTEERRIPVKVHEMSISQDEEEESYLTYTFKGKVVPDKVILEREEFGDPNSYSFAYYRTGDGTLVYNEIYEHSRVGDGQTSLAGMQLASFHYVTDEDIPDHYTTVYGSVKSSDSSIRLLGRMEAQIRINHIHEVIGEVRASSKVSSGLISAMQAFTFTNHGNHSILDVLETVNEFPVGALEMRTAHMRANVADKMIVLNGVMKVLAAGAIGRSFLKRMSGKVSTGAKNANATNNGLPGGVQITQSASAIQEKAIREVSEEMDEIAEEVVRHVNSSIEDVVPNNFGGSTGPGAARVVYRDSAKAAEEEILKTAEAHAVNAEKANLRSTGKKRLEEILYGGGVETPETLAFKEKHTRQFIQDLMDPELQGTKQIHFQRDAVLDDILKNHGPYDLRAGGTNEFLRDHVDDIIKELKINGGKNSEYLSELHARISRATPGFVDNASLMEMREEVSKRVVTDLEMRHVINSPYLNDIGNDIVDGALTKMRAGEVGHGNSLIKIREHITDNLMINMDVHAEAAYFQNFMKRSGDFIDTESLSTAGVSGSIGTAKHGTSPGISEEILEEVEEAEKTFHTHTTTDTNSKFTRKQRSYEKKIFSNESLSHALLKEGKRGLSRMGYAAGTSVILNLVTGNYQVQILNFVTQEIRSGQNLMFGSAYEGILEQLENLQYNVPFISGLVSGRTLVTISLSFSLRNLIGTIRNNKLQTMREIVTEVEYEYEKQNFDEVMNQIKKSMEQEGVTADFRDLANTGKVYIHRFDLSSGHMVHSQTMFSSTVNDMAEKVKYVHQNVIKEQAMSIMTMLESKYMASRYLFKDADSIKEVLVKKPQLAKDLGFVVHEGKLYVGDKLVTDGKQLYSTLLEGLGEKKYTMWFESSKDGFSKVKDVFAPADKFRENVAKDGVLSGKIGVVFDKEGNAYLKKDVISAFYSGDMTLYRANSNVWKDKVSSSDISSLSDNELHKKVLNFIEYSGGRLSNEVSMMKKDEVVDYYREGMRSEENVNEGNESGEGHAKSDGGAYNEKGKWSETIFSRVSSEDVRLINTHSSKNFVRSVLILSTFGTRDPLTTEGRYEMQSLRLRAHIRNNDVLGNIFNSIDTGVSMSLGSLIGGLSKYDYNNHEWFENVVHDGFVVMRSNIDLDERFFGLNSEIDDNEDINTGMTSGRGNNNGAGSTSNSTDMQQHKEEE